MTDFSLDTGALTSAFQHASARLTRINFADALWRARLDVWIDDPAARKSIANRLGWLRAIDFVTPQVGRLRAFADVVAREGFTDIVLLGMGGSSLAPEVMRLVLGVAAGYPRFRVLDSVDPDAVRDAMAHANSSLFVLASKSGSTIEPNTMAAEAQRRLQAAGVAQWGSHFIAITDEGTALHKRAQAEGFKEIFVNPSDIGGRYSALSFFGMVPAALMGVDVEGLLARANRMADACRVADPAANPGLALGAFMASGALNGRDKLTLLVPGRLESFGLWVEQLVAESTGKLGKGIVPIAGERADAPFTSDRTAVVVTLGNDTPAGIPRITASGAPSLTISMADTLSIGAEFLRWEVATAAAGLLLDINPFDEPNVQQAKDATKVLLDGYKSSSKLPIPPPDATVEGAALTLSAAAKQQLKAAGAARFLSLAREGDYVGLLAYLPPDEPAMARALDDARAAIGNGCRAATMFGYGPRYLHSTGQLHKGGANNGVFVIVTAAVGEDLPIPGEPFSFGVLELAQAVGDFQSLDKTGRRALHVHLPRRDAALLQQVIDALTRSAN